MNPEHEWNMELISILIEKLTKDFPNIKIESKPIVRDIFFQPGQPDKGISSYLQVGLFDQDIVIYEEEIDITSWKGIKNIKTHNTEKQANTLKVPKMIFELKYNNVNTHALITYSNIAADIKSIFPFCKYFLLIYYIGDSTDSKFLRNGKSFDHIIYFQKGKAKNAEYEPNQFENLLFNDTNVQQRFNKLLDLIRHYLSEKSDLIVK